MQPDIEVNANLFRIVFAASSREATRYYLNGVFVEPAGENGVNLVATDGHRMVVAQDLTGRASRPAIIQLRSDILRACKPKRDGRVLRIFGLGEKPSKQVRAEIYNKAGEDEEIVGVQTDVEIDGKFPAYRKVIPAIETGKGLAAFAPHLLADMAKIGGEFANEFDLSPPGMVVHSDDEKSPALITWGSAVRAFGVLMPIRADLSGMPAWMELPTKAAA